MNKVNKISTTVKEKEERIRLYLKDDFINISIKLFTINIVYSFFIIIFF